MVPMAQQVPVLIIRFKRRDGKITLNKTSASASPETCFNAVTLLHSNDIFFIFRNYIKN